MDDSSNVAKTRIEDDVGLLLAKVRCMTDDIPWLTTFLEELSKTPRWASPQMLQRLCDEILHLAIAELHPKAWSSTDLLGPVRYTNEGDGSVNEEELKFFIEALRNLNLKDTLDRLTDNMATFEKFPLEPFQNVLGERTAAELGKKRETLQKAESSRRKAKAVMKNGKLNKVFN